MWIDCAGIAPRNDVQSIPTPNRAIPSPVITLNKAHTGPARRQPPDNCVPRPQSCFACLRAVLFAHGFRVPFRMSMASWRPHLHAERHFILPMRRERSGLQLAIALLLIRHRIQIGPGFETRSARGLSNTAPARRANGIARPDTSKKPDAPKLLASVWIIPS